MLGSLGGSGARWSVHGLLLGGIFCAMSGARRDGTEVFAQDGDTDEEFRRGEGGYEGEAVSGAAGSGTQDGGSFVQSQIKELERKIRELEAKVEMYKKRKGANLNW